MNKQELIKKIKELKYHNASKKSWIDRELVLDLVKQLDEPQKVVVPQFVANWYEKHKYNFEFCIWDYVYRFDMQEDTSFKEWFNEPKTEPFKILVNMHQFGYTVEKEKRYRVSLKNGQPLLKAYLGKALYFSQNIAIERDEVTRKELEEAGFGDVFTSPLFEVEEVPE